MSLLKEFQAFALKGNVLDLAVGVVIGAAFGKIVTAMVNDLIMPLVGFITPKGDWRAWKVSPLNFALGDLLGNIVDFVLVAMVLFFVVVKLRQRFEKEPEAVALVATRSCPECLENVPEAARKCRACASVLAPLAVLLLLLVASPSPADEPKYAFATAPAKPPPSPWGGGLKIGFLSTTGNSQALSLAAGANGSYQAHDNRVSLTAGIAYVRSWITFANDKNGDGAVGPGELSRSGQDTTRQFNVQGRYDRFFGQENNSVFASAHVLSDPPAGKALMLGGQLGYTRVVFKSPHQQTSFEVGGDYTHEKYVDPTLAAVEALSGRVFINHTVKVTDTAGGSVGVEALDNVAAESTALNLDGRTGVRAGQDLRVNAVVAATAAVTKHVSLALSYTVKYDRVPAPLPGVTAPVAVPFQEGYHPLARPFDTLLDASVLVTFL